MPILKLGAPIAKYTVTHIIDLIILIVLKQLLPQIFNAIQNNLLQNAYKDQFLKRYCTSKRIGQNFKI